MASKKDKQEEIEGLTALLGEQVFILCMNYFFTGKLVVVMDDVIALENAKIIYETGNMTDSKWKDAQPLGDDELHYIMRGAIESFRKTSKT